MILNKDEVLQQVDDILDFIQRPASLVIFVRSEARTFGINGIGGDETFWALCDAFGISVKEEDAPHMLQERINKVIIQERRIRRTFRTAENRRLLYLSWREYVAGQPSGKLHKDIFRAFRKDKRITAWASANSVNIPSDYKALKPRLSEGKSTEAQREFVRSLLGAEWRRV